MAIQWQQLPSAIQQYKSQILATARDSISIELEATDALSLLQSKVGGLPYLPLTEDYPHDAAGKPLKLLAQINFAEVPAIADYPSHGILQFYIGGDDLFGADFEQPQQQDGFRVKYFAEVIEDIHQLHQDFGSYVIQMQADDFYTPLEGQYAMHFQQQVQYISSESFDFAPRVLAMQSIWEFEESYGDEDFYEAWLEPYQDQFMSLGHRLGGYPYFTQDDPRSYREGLQEQVLLLQIDSDCDDAKQIMWGDVGVANFFIHPDDLKARDFSKVTYNWDCS